MTTPEAPTDQSDAPDLEPDPVGQITPAFTEDDLRSHFESDDEPEPDPDPDPEPEPIAAEDPSDPSEPSPEPAVEVEEPVPAADHTAPEPERPATPDPTADPRTATIEIGGTTYLLSDVQAQLEWARSLTPDQAARVAAALTDPSQVTSTQPAQPTQPAPNPQFDPDEFVDPQLAQYVQQQLAERDDEIARLREIEEQRANIEFVEQQARIEQSWEVTQSTIAEQYGLSDIEMSALTSTMERSGIVAFLAQRDGIADPEALFRTAYEQTYWTTPEFRDRAIQATAQQTANEAALRAAEATQAQQDRKTRAAALTGGGGTPPSRQPAPPPSSSQDRLAALAEGIRQGMSTN